MGAEFVGESVRLASAVLEISPRAGVDPGRRWDCDETRVSLVTRFNLGRNRRASFHAAPALVHRVDVV